MNGELDTKDGNWEEGMMDGVDNWGNRMGGSCITMEIRGSCFTRGMRGNCLTRGRGGYNQRNRGGEGGEVGTGPLVQERMETLWVMVGVMVGEIILTLIFLFYFYFLSFNHIISRTCACQGLN